MPLPEDDEVQVAIEGLDFRPIKRKHVRVLVSVLQRVRDRLDARIDNIVVHAQMLDARADALDTRADDVTDALVALAARVTSDEATASTLGTRVTTLEGANVITLSVVADIGSLPASAGARQFFRVQGDANVYVGNGANKPLTKLVPVPL